MKHSTRGGFMLILAVVGVGLVAAAMLILAGLAHSLIFDANQGYLEACNRNLTASALAWAQQNRDKIRDSQEDEPIELDISGLDTADGNLQITVLEPRKRTPRLQINIEYSCRGHEFRRGDIYVITARH